jgi:hypothetical protein
VDDGTITAAMDAVSRRGVTVGSRAPSADDGRPLAPPVKEPPVVATPVLERSFVERTFRAAIVARTSVRVKSKIEQLFASADSRR